jgi:hypothetical protein
MTHVFDIFNQFATDPSKELEGVWHIIGPATRTLEDGKPDPQSLPRIRVARANNKKYSKLMVQEYEANKTILDRKDDFAERRNDEIMADIAAKALLTGWENLTFKGVTLQDGWTYEDANRMMLVKDFRELVGRLSNEQNKYLIVQQEEAAKN